MDQQSPKEVFSQVKGKAVDTMTLWAEANQRILKELTDFTAGTATESIRLLTELQQSTITGLAGVSALPWEPTSWQDGYQRAFKLFERNVQAMGRSAERLQVSAEQAGKGIQETFTTVAARMKDVYAQN